jgi:hypothetical protein
MARHILIEIDTIGTAYQQVDDYGQVQRYVGPEGEHLFDVVPTGLGSRVVDPAPKPQAWMAPAEAPAKEPAQAELDAGAGT